MDPHHVRLGVIGAGGWLGQAIVKSVMAAGVVPPDRLCLSSRTPREGLFPGATWVRDNQDLVERSNIVLISVRPADFPALNISATGKLVISVMSSIDIAQIDAALGTSRIIRALPNAAAAVAGSYTPWTAAPSCRAEDRSAARLIFAACGAEDELPDEAQIDYLAAVTGTGPAYPALLADALRRHAIANGIAPDIAQNAVNALLIGTGRLIESQQGSPADIVAEFLAYRGMTTAALESMADAGFDRMIADGVEAALETSRKLSPH